MSDGNLLTALSQEMADAVEHAAASTVLVNGRRRFPASGIAFGSDLVLTASHVLEREDEIPVMLPDGSKRSGDLLGRDPGSDLAVLRLDEPAVSTAEAASGDPRVGQLVLALGRPTSEGIQASLGIVSAIAGPVQTRRGGLLEQYIRTDAIPYPGFSGGPLVDSSGKVLGVNTSGLTRGSSLAIPAGLAWKIADALAENGAVRRGYLGVRSQPVEIPAALQEALGRQQGTGLLLVGVESNSPAAQAGLIVGDILTGFSGEAISEPDALFVRLAGEVVGQLVSLEILRAGVRQEVAVTIGERE